MSTILIKIALGLAGITVTMWLIFFISGVVIYFFDKKDDTK